jgi:hypothetical protein
LNYGQVRDAALKHMNQYSLAGTEIASTYNNQADYLRRIPELVDDAVWIIASGPRRIQEYKELRIDGNSTRMGLPQYKLPEDLWDIVPGGLLVVENQWEMPDLDSGYVRPDEHHIVFPARGPHFHGKVFLQYYRKPRSIRDCKNGAECPITGGTCNCEDGEYGQPPDCAVLDNQDDTHRPIPYYVAAHLLMHEDTFAYASLYNEWQNLLGSLVQDPQPHRDVVGDAYNFRYDVGWWD